MSHLRASFVIIPLMAFPVVIDIETKHTFRQFLKPADLGVSVAVVYDYATDTYSHFLEGEIAHLFPLLEKASYIVGYNITDFDLPVLQAYYRGDILQLPQFDLMEDIRSKIGRRIGLNDVASATLGTKKSGHGLQAIEWYENGEFDKLIQYCQDDVKVTKEVFDYGVRNDMVLFEKSPIRVSWRKYKEGESKVDVAHTLPF